MDLITDRTESDALLGNEKGVYSYTDLNRVEEAVRDIAEEISALGFAVKLQTKTDWGLPGNFSVSAWPVASQMKRYLQNVLEIRKILIISTQLPESMQKLDWNGANNIEKILQTAFARIEGIKQSYRYSGEFYAGEDIL